MTDTPDGPGTERLVSWKRIAQHLQCSERTARRWAAEEGLPVHRHTQATTSSVFAYRAELDAWLRNRPRPENGDNGDIRTTGESDHATAGARRNGLDAFRHNWRDAVFSRVAVIWGVVLVAVSIGSVSVLQSCNPAANRRPSLAFGRVHVEPFRVIGGRKEQAALAAPIESVQTNILDALATVGIEITAPDTDESAPAAEFNLAGTVEREGDRTRVTIALQQRLPSATVWSQKFVRRKTKLSDMRDHVTSLTARVLACGFNLRDERRDLPPKAFTDYLRYCTVIRIPSRLGGMKHLTEQLHKAYPDDPAVMAIRALDLSQGRPHERELALQLAKKVLEADPDNPMARLIPVLMLPRWKNWAKIESHMLDQLPRDELSKRASISNRMGIEVPYGAFLRRVGRFREAAELYSKVIQANPYEIFARAWLATLMREFGEYDIAEEHFDRIEREQPDWSLIYRRRLQIDLYYGDARAALSRLVGDSNLRRHLSAAYRQCYKAFARARISDTPQTVRTVEMSCAGIGARKRMCLFAMLGKLNRAYAAANELDPTQVWPAEFFYYRGMRNFRRDSRFWPLADKFGLVAYWLETDNWPDFCREKDLPFDCKERALAQRNKSTRRHGADKP